jgi:poly-gamma-glutamate synthesis protein (capsule biosynthesis protein)
MKWTLSIVIFFFLITTVGGFMYMSSRATFTKESYPKPESPTIKLVVEEEEQDTYKLGFVGDIMLDRGVRNVVEKKGITYEAMFSEISPRLGAYDLLFGNLEGPISATGTKQGSIYSFRMKPETGEALQKVGFDVLTVANNHAFDYGISAFEETLSILKDNDIAYVGGGLNYKEAYSPHVETLPDGTSVATFGFSQFGGKYMEAKKDQAGIALINTDFIKKTIASTSEKYDIVIITLHFGEEYESLPNKYQNKIAKLAIDEGADLVVGHHPHVMQPLERYKNGYIAYSLGNFIFDQNMSLETMTGYILNVSVKNKKISDAYIRATYQDTSFSVRILE